MIQNMNNRKLIKELGDIQDYIKYGCFGVSDLRYELALLNEVNRRGLK